MQNALVSIIICSYNNWPDLELAINSALTQTYRCIEVIVVDNDSHDQTSTEVVKRFGNRVKSVTQKNRGDCGAYNTGMSLAQGQFIQFMDGDDVLLPHKTEAQIAAFQQWPDTGIVYGDVRRFQSGSGQGTLFDFETWDYDDVLAMLLSLDGTGGIFTLNTLFSRSAVETIGP